MTMAASLPLRATALRAWRDAFALLVAFPMVWLTSIVASSALSLYAELGPLKQITANAPLFTFGWVVSYLVSWVPLALYAPAALLSHRCIILGRREPLSNVLADPRPALAYASLEGVTLALLVVPLGLLNAVDDDQSEIAIGFVLVVLISSLPFFCWVMARLSAVYPSLAIHGSGEAARHAWRATRGFVLRILAIVLLTTGPLILAILVSAIVEFGISGSLTEQRPLAAQFVAEFISTAAVLVGVAAMSNIYLELIGKRRDG